MKKLVLVAAMFMFVCGGSFLAKAQDSPEVKTLQVTGDTIVTDTVVKDTVATDTVSKDKPAEPVKG